MQLANVNEYWGKYMKKKIIFSLKIYLKPDNIIGLVLQCMRLQETILMTEDMPKLTGFVCAKILEKRKSISSQESALLMET